MLNFSDHETLQNYKMLELLTSYAATPMFPPLDTQLAEIKKETIKLPATYEIKFPFILQFFSLNINDTTYGHYMY